MVRPLSFVIWQLTLTLGWASLPLILTLWAGVVAPPAILIAAVCLTVKRLRRFWLTRWLGWLSVGVAVLFGCGPLVLLLQTTFFLGGQQVGLARRTHTLKQDTTYAGQTFPAGSTVVLREGTQAVESGKLSRPTKLQGLLVSGDFRQPLEEWEKTPDLDATLVEPATIAGLPCAAGAIYMGEQGASCVLAKDVDFQGFPLAGDMFAQLNRADAHGEWYLSQGVMARPVTMFDVNFPAGTIVAPGAKKLPELAHWSATMSSVAPICLPAGAVIKLRDAVFHGVMQIRFEGAALTADGPCTGRRMGNTGPPDGPRGFVELPGGRHIGMGSQAKPGAAWVEDEVYEGKGTY